MQETETLELPVSHRPVVIRGYVTGLIDQEVQKVRLAGNKISYELDKESLDTATADKLPDGGKMVMETDPTAAIRADNKLLELMLISVGEVSGELALVALRDLPSKDFNHVMKRVKDLAAAGEVSEDEKKDI